MTYKATAINVMIASPNDVSQERTLIRRVIEEWNAVNAQRRSVILMPMGWESHASPEMGERPQGIINGQVLKDSDLLIAVFWTRIGSSTGVSISGTVEEIEEHTKAGKPVMIYFSSAPVRPESVDAKQYEELQRFKAKCLTEGLCERYESLSEFREKLARQLALTVNRRFPEFDEEVLPQPKKFTPSFELSSSANELLLEAGRDRHGVIMRLSAIGGTYVQTNGREFITDSDARTVARWRGAVDELARLDLIEDRGGKGEVFFVTDLGYQFIDELKSLG